MIKYSWDKKKRTMLRFIEPGDFFCFSLPSGKFGVGRIISKVSVGHSAEIFDVELNEPIIPDDCSSWPTSFYEILDSYSIFDRKAEGEWRIVGNAEIDKNKIYKEIFFAYGSLGDRVKVNLLNQEFKCSEEEYKNLPSYRPAGGRVILRKMGY